MEIFIIWLVLAALVGALAHSRGRSGFGFFLLSAVLSPLLGLIVVLVTRDLVEDAKVDAARRDEREMQIESVRAIAATAQRPGPAPAAAPPVQSVTSVDRVIKLGEMLNAGLLTREEFEQQKAQLLTSSTPSVQSKQSAAPAVSEGPFGTCPNTACGKSIPLASPTCPHCKADFGSASIWRVIPAAK